MGSSVDEGDGLLNGASATSPVLFLPQTLSLDRTSCRLYGRDVRHYDAGIASISDHGVDRPSVTTPWRLSGTKRRLKNRDVSFCQQELADEAQEREPQQTPGWQSPRQ
jgi:hypothetical protein